MKSSSRSIYLTEEGFMTYQEFVQKVRDRLNERQEQNENLYSVKADTVKKIQGSYYGLVVSMTSNPVADFGVNLEKSFTDFIINKVSIEDVVNEVDQQLHYEIEHVSKYHLSNLKDYEYVKKHLGLQVINMEKNQEVLKNIPYTQIADLALVYRIFVDQNACALINNNMLKRYGISKEQLHSDAISHDQREKPCFIKKMEEVLKELLKKILQDKEMPKEKREEMKNKLAKVENDPPLQMYIAGIDGVYGASVIARPDFLEKATQLMGGDFYVIPSSIHEVIILKDKHQGSIREIEETIWEENMLNVSEEDFLSNNLYHYDSSDHIFETAAGYEQRMKNGPEMLM